MRYDTKDAFFFVQQLQTDLIKKSLQDLSKQGASFTPIDVLSALSHPILAESQECN